MTNGGGTVQELTAKFDQLITLLNKSLRVTESGDAFLEQRNILSNNADKPKGYYTSTYKAKAFSRGCRGHIQTLAVYVRNTSADATTIVFGVKSSPEATTEQFTITVIVPAYCEGWESAAVGRDWNFWGLFLYIKTVNGNAEYAYDEVEITQGEPSPTPDGWTSVDTGDNWEGENDRRYWFRVALYNQSKGEMGIGGHVSIIEVDKHIRVVITDEDGNIIGTGLPLNATTIIGSADTTFNNLADLGEQQKSYSAGDAFTADWIAGRDVYPYSINIVFRALHSSNIYPPNILEYHGIHVRLTSSDGQLLYDGMLHGTTFNLMTWDGTLYWVATLSAELGFRRVSSDVFITLSIKNSSGVTLDYIEPYILGATVPSE